MGMPPNQPPPGQYPYGEYNRGGFQPGGPGNYEQLEALWTGYKWLNYVFGLNVALVVGGNVATRSSREDVGVLLAIAGFLFLIITAATFPANLKIAQGKGWQPAMAILCSVLMGLNSALCCGIIGYVVMQSIAAKAMQQEHGVPKGGFFGMKRADVEARLAQLRR
jgi:hypothetical protein